MKVTQRERGGKYLRNEFSVWSSGDAERGGKDERNEFKCLVK